MAGLAPGVRVAVGGRVAVGLPVAVGVSGVAVAPTGVSVGVGVSVSVGVGVRVALGVGVSVSVGVGVRVALGVGVPVAVLVAVRVTVPVAVVVGVGQPSGAQPVGVGVGVRVPHPPLAGTLPPGHGVRVGVRVGGPVAVVVAVGQPSGAHGVGVGDGVRVPHPPLVGTLPPGHGVRVGVRVGGPVLTVAIKAQPLMDPSSGAAESNALSRQVPAKLSPSKALSGCSGLTIPEMAGALPQVVPTGSLASSSSVAAMFCPAPQRRTISNTLLPVSTCLRLISRSPTNVCLILRETSRSLIVPVSTTVQSAFPFPWSGMRMAGEGSQTTVPAKPGCVSRTRLIASRAASATAAAKAK